MTVAGEPFAVGGWLVEPSLNRITFGTTNLHLRPQVMEVLVYLAAQDGRVATLESIHDDLWAGKVVSTGTIYNCITELRQAFAQSGSGTDYIETLPKRGYRLTPRIVTMPAPRSPGALSIAVLPLANRSGGEQHDYLCEGIADELLYSLSKTDGVRVCSARPLKDEQLDTRVIGLRYGAELVLSGSLQSQDSRMRVMLRLENVQDGHVAWSGRFEEQTTNLLALQESVARQIIAALATVLPGRTAAMPILSGTRNVEALQALLMGRHTLSGATLSSHNEALRFLQRAVEIDPEFARAHYRLYLALYLRYRNYGLDAGGLDAARQAAARARELGYRPPVPWVHVHRRLHPEARLTSRQLALEAIGKIRDRDPEWSSFACEQLSWALADAGLAEGTLAFARKALASPDHDLEDSDIDEEVPNYAAACGHLDEAIRLRSGLVQQDPRRALFRCERAILYARTGQFDCARSDVNAIDHRAFRPLSETFLAWYERRDADVRRHCQALLSLPRIHPWLSLYPCLLSNDIAGGIELIGEAVNEKARAFVDFGVIRATLRARLPPALVDEIEGHPSFLRLLAEQGVDEAWRRELVARVNEVSAITGIVIDGGALEDSHSP